VTEKQKLQAIAVDDFGGTLITDDRSHALFRFEVGGSPLDIALPKEALSSMLQGVVRVYSELQDHQKLSASSRPVFSVDWWEIGMSAEGTIVLSLRLPGCGFLSFELAPQMIPQIQETLAALTSEPSMLRRPETPLS
jgi:hypothetical protein